MLVLLHELTSCLQASGSELDVEGLLVGSMKCSSVPEGYIEVGVFRMFSWKKCSKQVEHEQGTRKRAYVFVDNI